MIKVSVDENKVDVDFHGFSGGERNIKIKPSRTQLVNDSETVVEAHLTSSEDVIDLLLLKDAIDNHISFKDTKKKLVIPYLPYARQDRAMVYGEALSIRVFAKLINSMNFDYVQVSDPHSDVGPALLNNLEVVQQSHLAIGILVRNMHFRSIASERNLVVCSPDAGALKKCSKFAKSMDLTEMVIGIKHRDLATGEITGTSFTGADVKGKDVLMVDDICDGGATFYHLGKALKDAGANRVLLYVTHGIFSKGVDGVFTDIIDGIYTAYPWRKYVEGNDTKGLIKTIDQTGYFG
jgi:ribose-phosphate pyrophosphokinase